MMMVARTVGADGGRYVVVVIVSVSSIAHSSAIHCRLEFNGSHG